MKTHGRMRAWMAAAVLAAGLAGARAEQKIATVDLDRCFNEYYKTRLADGQMEEQQNQFEADRKKLVDEARRTQDELERLREAASSKALTDEGRVEKRLAAEDKALELKDKDSGIRRAEDRFEREMSFKQKMMRQKLVDEILAVARDVAQKQGCALLFDSSGKSLNGVPTVVYADPKLDLTTAVIAQLNRGQPAAKPK